MADLILQDYTTSSILSGIDGKSPSTDITLFSDYTSVGTLTRNTDCWAHNLSGFTGIVAWNDRSGQEKLLGGIAITKRHIIYTKHAAYSNGDVVYFVTKDDTLIDRTILRSESTPSGDFVVALLNSDLPDDVQIVPVLPRDSYRYFDNTQYTGTSWYQPSTEDVLLIGLDQEEKATVQGLKSILFKSFDDSQPLGYFTSRSPIDSPASDWYETPVVNDSGSPVLMLLDQQAVLIGFWSTTTSGPFVSTAWNYDEINRLIGVVDAQYSIDTGYTLTDVNLTGYNEYIALTYTSPALADLPLSATSLAVFETGVSPYFDITWSFNYEVSGYDTGDGLGFTLFLQNATVPLTGGGVGDDLGYSGGASGDMRSRGLSGGVLGIGFDTHGFFALEKQYEDGTTRSGIALSARNYNSVSVRGDEASGYAYQDSNVAISAFDILSEGVKTIRGRLGNYGRTVYLDYKGSTDNDFTNLLTKDIDPLTFDVNTFYRPGITISKPLTSSNSNAKVFITNFHVEGKTTEDAANAINTYSNEFTPLTVYSINSDVLGPPKEPESVDLVEQSQRLPFLGIEPAIGCPDAYCGLSAYDTTAPNEYYPATILYSISAFIGTVEVQAYNPDDKPVRFMLVYDKDTVIDTGYLGGSDYQYGGDERQTFINAIDSFELAEPSTSLAADGYPEVSTTTAFLSTFYKDTDKARATFNVYNPLSASDWEVYLGCPIREVDCGEDVTFECGLYRVYPAATKVNTN